LRSVPTQPQRLISTAQPQRPTSNYAPVQSWQAYPTFQQTPVQYGFRAGMKSTYADRPFHPYTDMTSVSSRYTDQPNVIAGANLPQYASGYNYMAQRYDHVFIDYLSFSKIAFY